MESNYQQFFTRLSSIIKEDNVQKYQIWFKQFQQAIYSTTSPDAEEKLRKKLTFDQVSKRLQKIPNTPGKSLAHLLASENALKLVRYIIREKYILLQQDDFNATPMHDAAFAGNLDMMLLLREQGLRLSHQDVNGCRALHIAAMGGHRHVIDFIIAKIRKDKKYLFLKDKNGALMMHHAAEHGHLELMKHFKKLGIPFNVTDSRGRTPLHAACIGGQKAVIKYLLANSQSQLAHIDAKGCNAFHLLARHDHAQLLLELYVEELHSQTAQQRCQKSFMPIHHAVMHGARNAVAALMKIGHSLETQGPNGVTCLLLALECADIDMVTLLVNSKANKNATDLDGCNAWFYAAGAGKEDFLTQIEIFAFPAQPNHHGRTPLHIAVQTGRLKVLKKLENLGFPITSQDVELIQQLKELAISSEGSPYTKGEPKREEGVSDIIRYLDTKMHVKRLRYHSTASLETVQFIAKEGKSRPVIREKPDRKRKLESKSHSCVRTLFMTIIPTDQPAIKKTKEQSSESSMTPTLPMESFSDEDQQFAHGANKV